MPAPQIVERDARKGQELVATPNRCDDARGVFVQADPMATNSKVDSSFVRARVYAAGGALTVLAVSYAYAPYANHGPVVCLLRGMTGMPCPFCGLTRAFCALAHGKFLEALHHHALSPILFAAVVATPIVAAIESATGRNVSRRVLSSSKLLWSLAALFIIYYTLRTTLWLVDSHSLW